MGNNEVELLSQLVREFNIPVDSQGTPDWGELRGQLADAMVLYDVASGRASIALLTEILSRSGQWTPQQKRKAADDLTDWILGTTVEKE